MMLSSKLPDSAVTEFAFVGVLRQDLPIAVVPFQPVRCKLTAWIRLEMTDPIQTRWRFHHHVFATKYTGAVVTNVLFMLE